MKKMFNSGKAQFAFLLVLIVGGLSQGAWAGTTTLNFNTYSSGTVLTNQYESQGVTISGATILASCTTCDPFPSVSGTNVAYAPTGLMTLTFDPTVVVGQITTVSAYVSDNLGPAGIYAYDSSNNLLAQSVLAATGGTNVLLSVTSSSGPISYVTIHDGGSQFAIDNFTFTWTASCSGDVEDLQSDVAALPTSDFKNPRQASQTQKLITAEISILEKLVAAKGEQALILTTLGFIQAEVNITMVEGSDKIALLSLIQQIVATAKTGQC
jgi:hypothetical protein